MKALATKIVTIEIATDAPLRVLRNKALWQGGPPAAGQYTCEVRHVTVAVAQPAERKLSPGGKAFVDEHTATFRKTLAEHVTRPALKRKAKRPGKAKVRRKA
jgi:hypothetical protein